jgi:hypothetical protein
MRRCRRDDVIISILAQNNIKRENKADKRFKLLANAALHGWAIINKQPTIKLFTNSKIQKNCYQTRYEAHKVFVM